MANKRRDSIKRNGSETFADDPSATKREEHLRRSFEKFRREHRPRTPIAQALRDEALAALRDGMAELTVRRACGISPEQLYWWRKAQYSTERGSERGRHEASHRPMGCVHPAARGVGNNGWWRQLCYR
jgi:hypothetical protein